MKQDLTCEVYDNRTGEHLGSWILVGDDRRSSYRLEIAIREESGAVHRVVTAFSFDALARQEP